MTDDMDPRAKLDILNQAIYDAKIVYNKNNHPTLDKNDHKILEHLYNQIERMYLLLHIFLF